MGINIVSMIRGRREARAQGIEELARRLAAGEAIAPEDIEAILDETGTDEEMLQAAVDRIERRAGLLAAVARGNAAQAKADRIHADLEKALAVVTDAQEKYSALRLKHHEALADFERQQAEGLRAAEALLEPDNLSPADRERLAQARQTATDAAQAAGDLRRQMRDLRGSLEQAERELPDAKEYARLNRSNPDAQARAARAENAVSARKARVAEAEAQLPKLVAEADRTAAAVETIEAELRR